MKRGNGTRKALRRMACKAMASISEMETGSKTGFQTRISVTSIVVNTGRLICEVSVPDPSFRHTNSAIAQRLSARFPSLGHHACVNAVGRTFGCVMERTSMPHVLEHLVIELQTRASDDPQAMFVGTTEWVDEAAGIARVQVSYLDDLQALRALSEALDILNGIDEG